LTSRHVLVCASMDAQHVAAAPAAAQVAQLDPAGLAAAAPAPAVAAPAPAEHLAAEPAPSADEGYDTEKKKREDAQRKRKVELQKERRAAKKKGPGVDGADGVASDNDAEAQDKGESEASKKAKAEAKEKYDKQLARFEKVKEKSPFIRTNVGDARHFAQFGEVFCVACDERKGCADESNWGKHEKTEK